MSDADEEARVKMLEEEALYHAKVWVKDIFDGHPGLTMNELSTIAIGACLGVFVGTALNVADQNNPPRKGLHECLDFFFAALQETLRAKGHDIDVMWYDKKTGGPGDGKP